MFLLFRCILAGNFSKGILCPERLSVQSYLFLFGKNEVFGSWLLNLVV